MGIILHFIPTYSPNLNPIERLWKLSNEYTRNNRFFKSAGEFRAAVMEFYEQTWKTIAKKAKSRINDNFQVFPQSSFST
ncbi:hypothetical protein FACS189449_08180 [Alphaproteobacteria bacterium]|nr:hypothetical protein FACS189449_08180 [Alphaproteobacteria bacterium]